MSWVWWRPRSDLWSRRSPRGRSRWRIYAGSASRTVACCSSSRTARGSCADMTIDKSGKWWVGSEIADVQDYLVTYRAGGYEVHETRICVCVCGAADFKLSADADEGCA